jgi:hypothetical protein
MKSKKPKPNTIAFRALQLLQTKRGLSAEEIAKRIRAEFRGAYTSADSVAWYASKARKSGVTVNLKRRASR